MPLMYVLRDEAQQDLINILSPVSSVVRWEWDCLFCLGSPVALPKLRGDG